MKRTSIFVTNLGKYNEGQLVGEWLPLPATNEEVKACLDRIGINEYYEEYFITDYDNYTNFDLSDMFGEYSSIENISDFIEELENLEEYEKDVVCAYMDNYGYSFEEALDHKDDAIIWNGCRDMSDVAVEYCRECGILDQMPEHLQNYFDFDSFGRDMTYDSTFIAVDDGYIELTA